MKILENLMIFGKKFYNFSDPVKKTSQMQNSGQSGLLNIFFFFFVGVAIGNLYL